MRKLLYITDGVFPETIGGMQKVAAQHIKLMSDLYELCVIYSGREIENPLPNVTYIHLNWPKVSRLWLFLSYIKQLKAFSCIAREYIDTFQPDIIYSEGPLLDCVIKHYKDKHIPIVFHPHGLEPFQDKKSIIENIKSSLLASIVRRHCIGSDIVLYQGGKLKDILVKDIGVDSSKIRILGNVFGDDSNSKKESLCSLDDKPIDLIFVGRNEKRKGLTLFLETLEKLPHKVSVCIVGAHSRLNGDYPTKHDINWVGEITDSSELYDLYNKSKFFVLPSFAEGMPTVILESMAFGVPVIAADVGAVGEIVTHGKNGYLFSKGNRGELADFIQNALSLSNEEYSGLSKQARTTVEDNYSPKVIKQKLDQIIKNAIN